jgi:hypothetical protein
MKRYLFGLFALVFACAAVAFTTPKKLATKNFKFIGLTTSQTQVNDGHKWEEVSSLTCTGGDVQACVINTVSDVYYHFDSGAGVDVLNNAADAVGTDLRETITSTLNGTTYFVATATSGSIDNKQ